MYLFPLLLALSIYSWLLNMRIQILSSHLAEPISLLWSDNIVSGQGTEVKPKIWNRLCSRLHMLSLKDESHLGLKHSRKHISFAGLHAEQCTIVSFCNTCPGVVQWRWICTYDVSITDSCACHTQFINQHFNTQPEADNKSFIIKYQISDNKIIRQALMLHNIKTIKLTNKTKGNLLRVSVQ